MSNEELVKRYQAGEQEALILLWDKVYRLAYKIASSYRELLAGNRAVDIEDLMQSAFLGVEYAARHYDAEKALFSTYAALSIRKQCRAALGLQGRLRKEHYYTDSLDEPISEEGEGTKADMLEDTSLPPSDSNLLQAEMVQTVRAAVAELPGRQAEVIARYWLEGSDYAEIAAFLGLSLSRAQQLGKKGLRSLSRRDDLQELADAACWRHVSLGAYRTTLTSATEAAALYRMSKDLDTEKRAIADPLLEVSDLLAMSWRSHSDRRGGQQ